MKKLFLALCVIAACGVLPAQTPPYIRKPFALVDPLTYGAVCKGSDANATADTTGIINAVAYVNTQPANSITLRIPGECVIDGTATLTLMTISANNVTVEGPGRLRIKTTTPPLNQLYNIPSGTLSHYKFMVVSGNNVTVEGVTFDSNGQAVTNCGGTYGCLWFDGIYGSPAPDKLSVINNRFPALGGWPVLTGGTDTIIRGNYATESAGMVCANGASGCQIVGNNTRSAIDAPYAVNGGNTTPGLVTHFLIANNVAIGESAITPNGNGIDVTAATDGEVSGNYITGMGNGCIQVGKTGGFYTSGAAGTFLPSQRINVVGNTCYANNKYGGWPSNGEIIVGDYYSAHGGTPWAAGDTANNIVVKDNLITAYNSTSNDYGVYVGFGSENVKVAGNYFAGCGTAVSGACGVTPYRIFDTGQTANLIYVNNHQDATYAGTIRTQGPGPYEIWGNNAAWSVASGGPTAGGFDYEGNVVSAGHIIIPQAVTGYHGTSGSKLQLSDGTGASGNFAKYASDGSTTDSSIAAANVVQKSGGLTIQTCTTASTGGSALAAGASATGTCTITNSATGHVAVAVASDGSVQGNYAVLATVSGTTATVTVTAITAGTPTAKTYAVSVF